MGKASFHKEPYDAGTLTKLEIFESYVQAWVPVFTSRPEPPFPEIHIFDLFSGPGTDSLGAHGSPLRILSVLKKYQQSDLHGWNKVRIGVHFSDSHKGKINELAALVTQPEWQVPSITPVVQPHKFEDALTLHASILENPRAAKLLIIDQFGVNAVTDEVFKYLIKLPTTDFIFFVSSSTLHRFRDHPAIKVKIDLPDDSYDVHRCAFDHFKEIAGPDYFLGRFSIRKQRGNIYGLIFGSGHQLGIHKFLDVAWGNDSIAGEANFDIERENVASHELLLPIDEMRPKKIQAFEMDLEAALRTGALHNEADMIRFYIEAGMTHKHCTSTIKKLKDEAVIACDFRSPSIDRFSQPRAIVLH
jgi:three-Cys-motif partner protein